jgi:hypothetical protein
MEFLDEDARPRFVLQSKPPPKSTLSDPQTQPLHKVTVLISLSLSTIFLFLSFLYFTSEPLKSLLIWLSVSLLVGPFAPVSLTAGDIRVGLGPPLEEPSKEIEKPDDSSKRVGRKASKFTRKADDPIFGSESYRSGHDVAGTDRNRISSNTNGSSTKLENFEENDMHEEADWIEGEEELLKKLMGKHPVGKPGRWEAIAEGFKGRHSVECVIKRAKEMGERKVNDDDSYRRFLRDRKSVDKRIEGGNEPNNGASENAEVEGESTGWGTGEDLALLNALKAFPKDVAMRWEKVAAAVPGKTKAACLKRVNELKKDFRSSKAAATEA